MAFPTTSVIDAFTRADGGLGANYSANPEHDTGESGLSISSNAVRLTGTTFSYGAAWYNASTFGPDSECYITVATASTAATFGLYLRLVQPSASVSTVDGYLVEIASNGTNVNIFRLDNGVRTVLSPGGETITAFANGEVLGFEAIGSTIQAYKNGTSIISRTDSTYTGAGYIGLQLYEDTRTTIFDNLGGGTIGAAPAGALANKPRVSNQSVMRSYT